jgi:hypothetical protein
VKIRRAVLDSRRRVHGDEHPGTLIAAGKLADSLLNLGSFAEAELIAREALGVSKRVLGDEHPDTLIAADKLAASLSPRQAPRG